jgi:hypothetical protein
VDWLVEANISEKSVLSLSSALMIEMAYFSETLASTNQSTWQFNPKEHHQNFHAMKILNLTSFLAVCDVADCSM